MDKPTDPGPASTEAERARFANANAAYAAWLAANPPAPEPPTDGPPPPGAASGRGR